MRLTTYLKPALNYTSGPSICLSLACTGKTLHFIHNFYLILVHSQIPGATSRQKTYLELPHLNTTEIPGPQDQELYWIIGKHSPLSLNNKLLIYKAILKPAWTYGIELWGCASPSNIAKIQRYQSKLLRLITNAPWFVTNQTLHQDLCIEKV